MTWGISIITTIENGHFFLRDFSCCCCTWFSLRRDQKIRFTSKASAAFLPRSAAQLSRCICLLVFIEGELLILAIHSVWKSPKMSHLNFWAKNGQYCIRRFYFECKRFTRIVVKWDFLTLFKTLCLFWGVQLCTKIVGNKKMVVVIADLAWLNGPNRTPGYVWWNLLKTLPRLSCKKRHLTRCFEKAALPPQAKCKIIFLKYGAHLSSS